MSHSSKANLADVKKTIAEIAGSLEQRVTFNELKRMLDAKADVSDLRATSKPANMGEIKNFMKSTDEALNSLQSKAKGARGWESLMQRITELED